ncbi:sensor histidine kinase [Streptomyces olivoreticuli]|uniref:sensor histidine kinase n=1 Tax=Streptomyces olivoreticuli TaxID=68246 RepID=UPI001F076F68|nr:histidine kinase [Streptomyces olivoreticuli]
MAAVLALLAAGTEDLTGSDWPRMLAAALAVAALSLLRRALPVPVLLATAVLTGATPGGLLLLAPVGWSAGHRIAGAVRAVTAFAVSCVVCVAASAVIHRLTPWELAFTTLVFLASAVVPGLTSRYWYQRRTLMRALQERNAQLLREREMVSGQARMRERQRIAQDMHDSLGHQLALIAVHTGALEVDRKLTGQQREAVAVLREASVAAMHELRQVVGILKGSAAEETPVVQPVSGAVAGIEALVESAAAAGTAARFERSGEPQPLAPVADHAAYRIAQEGLTNAYKHAPGAPITVSLRYEPDSMVVEVANGPVPGDSGPWPAAVSGGQGLTGLRERARLVGGMVHAGPVDGGGFRLAGVLPYGTGEKTFVDAANDFRQQTRPAAPGEGGPVTDWSDPREEFKNIMGSKKSRGLLIGCGAALLLILVGLAAVLVYGVGKLLDEAEKATIDPSVYTSVKVGDSEDQVREKLPSGDSILTTGAKDKGPAEPAGASCLTLLSTDVSKGMLTDIVYRFCFKDGKLIEKREFEVKN